MRDHKKDVVMYTLAQIATIIIVVFLGLCDGYMAGYFLIIITFHMLGWHVDEIGISLYSFYKRTTTR